MLNATGKLVTTLVGERLHAGVHRVTWDAGHMPEGLYYVTFEAMGRQVTRAVVVMR